jgi:hypothetical protein
MDAEAPRLVAGGRHDAALARAADRDRLAPQLGIVPLLDRCIEGIEIDMHDPALPFRVAET